MGETTALESDSKVPEATFRLRNGLLPAGRLEAVVGAMMFVLDDRLAQEERCVV